MISRIRFRGLRPKLVLALLAMGLLPMTAITALVFFKSRGMLLDDASATMQVAANEALDKIDRTLAAANSDGLIFASNPSARGSKEQVTGLMNSLMARSDRYDLMIVADITGHIVAVNTLDYAGQSIASAGLIGQNVKDKEWFTRSASGALRAGQSYVTDVELDPMVAAVYGGGGQTVAFSTPIHDAAGKVVGVWSNRVSLRRILTDIIGAEQELLAKVGHPGVEGLLIAQSGMVLAARDTASIMHLNLVQAGRQAAKLASQGKGGSITEADTRTHVRQVTGYAASVGALGFAGLGWGLLLQQDEATATASAGSLRNQVLIVGTLDVLLIIALAWWLAGTITRPITKTVAFIGAIAESGDLARSLAVESDDEIGVLARSFNDFLVNLRLIVTGMRASSETVTAASREVAGVADSLSSAAQSQAASLEETTASMEDLTATVKRNAESAQHANALATSAREVADRGGRVVGEAVAAMGDISRSSQKIEEIISTINEIAFQTNLLALNAAVEAARAGAQGRGFAVVATEVRNLAARSAAAAKEIKVLIQESSQKVEHGTKLVNQSGLALEEIVTSVKRVTDIVGEITVASAEQRIGIEEVSEAVRHMDTVTQQNAAQTEELSATASTLAQQAGELNALLQWFGLDDEAAAEHEDEAEVALAVPSRIPSRTGAVPDVRRGGSKNGPARLRQAKRVHDTAQGQAAGQRRTTTTPINGKGAKGKHTRGNGATRPDVNGHDKDTETNGVDPLESSEFVEF